MKKLALAGILVAVSAVYAQAPQYNPNEQQSMDLRIKSLDAQKAQAVWLQKAYELPEYKAYQEAQKAVKLEAESIKTVNKWPASVEFNDASLTFYEAPAAKK